MFNNYKVGIFPEYPFFIVFGGAEVQCLETYKALKSINSNIFLMDYLDKGADYDVIHFFGNPPSLKELYFLNSKKRKIVLSSITGSSYHSYWQKLESRGLSFAASLLGEETNYVRAKYIFHNSDKIIVLNKKEKSFLNCFYGVCDEKITIIPNGVNQRFFVAKENLFIKHYGFRNFVLFVGNITQRKNPLILAKALNRRKIQGVFIGKPLSFEGKYLEKFSRLINKSKNLLWINKLNYGDPLLVSAYAAAGVFCLPSKEETQPISALESLASGTPIILGDFSYAHQDPFANNALFCNPDNENEIIMNIEKVLKQKKDSNTVRLSDQYTWENAAKKILDIYKDIANEN